MRELSGTGERQLRHKLTEFNLVLASAFLPLRAELSEPRYLDQRVAAIRDAMQFSRRLGTSVLVVSPGPLPDQESAGFSVYREIVSGLAAHGNRVGSELCLRPARGQLERVSGLIRTIDSGPVRIDYTPADTIAAGRSVTDDLADMGRFVAHVRAIDKELGPDGELVEVPPGRGRVPWLELTATLNDAGFAGWMTLERSGERAEAELAEAVTFLKSLVPV